MVIFSAHGLENRDSQYAGAKKNRDLKGKQRPRMESLS